MKIDWQNDIDNDQLPRDLDSYEKGPGELKAGQRIGWWYKDDVDFQSEHGDGIDLLEDPPFGGIVIPREGIEERGDYFDVEEMVVVMDRYPAEKCYCETIYIAYRRLVDSDDLVKVILINR